MVNASLQPSHRGALSVRKRRHRWHLAWLAVCWFGFAGGTGAKILPHSSPALTSDGDSTPSLKTVKADQLRAILKQKRNKVVLLNFWATWCAPCREEFPALIKLYGKYRSKGLELILISVDNQELQDQVKTFLKQSQANFPSYISAEEDMAVLFGSIAPDWMGTLPMTFVFNRRGKLTQTLAGGQNYEVFHKAVTPLF